MQSPIGPGAGSTMNTPAGSTTPGNIELIGNELAVLWEDGHESFWQMAVLRDHCPCALCKSQEQKERQSDPGAQKQAAPANPLQMLSPEAAARASVTILRYEIVGRYAIRFIWSDRHDSGIYDFRLLRGLCPCGECSAGNEEK